MESKNEKGSFGNVLKNILKQSSGKKRKNVVLLKAKLNTVQKVEKSKEKRVREDNKRKVKFVIIFFI